MLAALTRVYGLKRGKDRWTWRASDKTKPPRSINLAKRFYHYLDLWKTGAATSSQAEDTHS